MNKTPALYGGSMDSHDISSKLADNFNRLSAEAALTERERYVVYLIMKGITTTTITKILNRSIKTISAQKCSAYEKLGVSNDVQFIRKVISSIKDE